MAAGDRAAGETNAVARSTELEPGLTPRGPALLAMGLAALARLRTDFALCFRERAREVVAAVLALVDDHLLADPGKVVVRAVKRAEAINA